MIRFRRLIAAFRFRSCRVPQSGQVHMRSRFSFGFTVPQTLQVLLLGNHIGARTTRVWRHWPLASSSRAGTQYPRHLARALDFPGSAHPRQERGGARLSQHGVTAPGDDADYVDLEGNHQVGDQDSFPPEAGCRAGFTIPVWGWPVPARQGASAPCLGATSS